MGPTRSCPCRCAERGGALFRPHLPRAWGVWGTVGRYFTPVLRLRPGRRHSCRPLACWAALQRLPSLRPAFHLIHHAVLQGRLCCLAGEAGWGGVAGGGLAGQTGVDGWAQSASAGDWVGLTGTGRWGGGAGARRRVGRGVGVGDWVKSATLGGRASRLDNARSFWASRGAKTLPRLFTGLCVTAGAMAQIGCLPPLPWREGLEDDGGEASGLRY